MRSLYLLGFLGVAIVLATCNLSEAVYDRKLFKEQVYNDDSNDDAINLNAQGLIKRSGYRYRIHYVIADDGYVTQLIHLINPLADKTKLKWPPVMLFHGANIDNSAYLLASSIQHHPEKYPRSNDADGPITSSSRSLAFTLANNGFDVWLVSTRGSNEENQAVVELGDIETFRADPNWVPREEDFNLVKNDEKKYWQYGLDDIISYELKNQIDKVRQLTGSDEVSIFSFSLSTPTTMAFLANEPEYARKVRVYAQMAPAIAADHFTTLDTIYFEKICPKLPTRGIGFTPTYSVKPFVRSLIKWLSKYKKVKYTFIHSFLTALFGPSLKYHTNLERNFLVRVFQPVSFKSVQHYCENSVSKRLTKFDYGKKENLIRYGSEEPPVYKVDRLEVQNWVVIWGTYDALADPSTVDRLIKSTKTPKPAIQIVASGFNHADFLAAVEIDKYVVLPFMAELDKYSEVKSD